VNYDDVDVNIPFNHDYVSVLNQSVGPIESMMVTVSFFVFKRSSSSINNDFF
jgi:hypothetical protein